MIQKWGLVFLTLFLISCASVKQSPTVDIYADAESDLEESVELSLSLAQQRALDRLKQNPIENPQDPEKLESVPLTTKEHVYLIPTREEHPKVQKWIQYYSVKDRERFQRFLNRGAKYKDVIQDLFVTHGLPPDLYYLGILESGFVTEATSRVGAMGPWQFMAPTGREYGLKINNYVDERLDIIRSSLAAIRYLKELYRQKKSWPLAMAAYNAGPGRVRRAMRRGGSQNYWNLTSRYLLPYDTREYIPQFLAILHIGKNLDKYQFVEEPDVHFPEIRLVKAPSSVPLAKISEVTNVSLEELKFLNPHLIKDITPPIKSSYRIWVRKEQADGVKSLYDQMALHKVEGLQIQTRRMASSYSQGKIHRVQRGQNLGLIAKRYGTSVSKIKRLNGLDSHQIYVGQKLKVRGTVTRNTTSVASTATRIHRVKAGENLSTIASRYNLTLSQIKNYNNLTGSKIFKGQRLKLYGEGPSVKRVAKSNPKQYRIRTGDNLYKIAKKFGITIAKIKKLNNLRSNNIQKGQLLIIASNP